MQRAEDLEIGRVEDRADGDVCKERWEDLVRDETPAVCLDCMGEQARSGGPPGEDAAATGLEERVEGFGGGEVVDSSSEEGFHGGPEVEGYGLRGEGADAGGGGARCSIATAVGSGLGQGVGRDYGEDALELAWVIDGHVGIAGPSWLLMYHGKQAQELNASRSCLVLFITKVFPV